MTKVLELNTLEALNVSEYPRKIPLSIFEPNFASLSHVSGIKHLHLNG